MDGHRAHSGAIMNNLAALRKALKPILHALMVFQGIDEISDEQKLCVDMGDTTIIAAGCTVGDLRRIVEVVESAMRSWNYED
jgi:metal-dependent hydrolase (beta-lactamase superfamily II)